VPPEYWDTVVAVLLIEEMARRAAAKGYRWADLSLTSADNPRTPQLAEHLGAVIYKRYRVYRRWLAGFPSTSPSRQRFPRRIRNRRFPSRSGAERLAASLRGALRSTSFMLYYSQRIFAAHRNIR
jgi:hypothetical protein